MSIGLLASGHLGFVVFQKLLDHFDVTFVFTNLDSAEIISLCKQRGIPCYVGNPRGGRAIKRLPNLACDVLVSVNYLFLIEEDIIRLPKIMAVNFHGSLLPKYRGRTPHVWSIINNEQETGITAHKITIECDAGAILGQLRLKIDSQDTGGSILRKFEAEYPGFVLDILQRIRNGSCDFADQDSSKATYFGKRGPEDGRIDWNWQKERLYNWVRAQTRPYPGAFTFCKGERLVIYQIDFSDCGFRYELQNGTVLKVEDGYPIVKTPNGAVRLLDLESNCKLLAGQILE